MTKPRVITEGELRSLIRRMVREYVANDTPYNANKELHPDPSAATWDQGMDQDSAPSVAMDEADEDHEDPANGRGGERWEDHADPTAKAWDVGME